MSHTSHRILQYLYRGGMVFLFLLFSTVLIASANGFLFDRQTMQFEMTGIINLTVKQQPVNVTLNGKSKKYTSGNIRLTYLLPGSYTIDVAKTGYVTWSKTIDLNSGQAVLNPFVFLFPADPEIKPATSAQIADLTEAQKTPYEHPDMDIRGNEVWVKPISRTNPFTITADNYELIGRFISPVLGARWFEGKNRVPTHVVFQVDKEIRIMDRDGSNDITLVTLKSGNPTPFMIDQENKILIYQDGDQVFQRPLQ